MKHIKTYENDIASSNTKNYIVYSHDKLTHLEILKNIKVEYDDDDDIIKIWTTIELFYEKGQFKEVGKFLENKPAWLNEKSKDILFSADSIEECKEFIELTISANKYNL